MDYTLKLELNTQNIMIFILEIESKDVSIILFEDKRRKGELLKDFPYLYPRYYESEEQWDDNRNLVKVTIFPLRKNVQNNSEMMTFFQEKAEALIEHKSSVNVSIEVVFDEKVSTYFFERDENYNRFINYINSYCEKKYENEVSVNDLDHLSQYFDE